MVDETSESTQLIAIIEKAALSKDVDADKMRALWELQKDVRAENARMAYLQDFKGMQSELPAVIKRAEIKHKGQLISTYATFEDIWRDIKPILHKYGFSMEFKTSQNGQITVIGRLSHTSGHVEQSELSLPADTSGAKNNVQAIGSAVSYGKRYVMCSMLNIVTEGEDDDGNLGGPDGGHSQKEALTRMHQDTKKWEIQVLLDEHNQPDWSGFKLEMEGSLKDCKTMEDVQNLKRANNMPCRRFKEYEPSLFSEMEKTFGEYASKFM